MLKNVRISGDATTTTKAKEELHVPKNQQQQLVEDSNDNDHRHTSPTACHLDPSRSSRSATSSTSSDASSSSSLSSLTSSFTLLEELTDSLIGISAVYWLAEVRGLLRGSDDRNNATATANRSPPSPSAPRPSLDREPGLLRKAIELPITRPEMRQLLQANLSAIRRTKVAADLYLSLLDSSGSSTTTTEETTVASSLSSSSSSLSSADASENAPHAFHGNNTWRHSKFESIPVPTALLKGSSDGLDPPASGSSSISSKPSAYVAVFDDENSNAELVYCIAVDEARGLIGVVFRGSITVRDWVASFDSRMKTVPNPLRLRREPSENGKDAARAAISPTVSIHRGFCRYLFGSNSKSGSKYETIVGHVKRLLVTYPGYKIRVSGHSSGGALSTLFAFAAAADPDLPKPVTCVSFASPRVGNLEWARAYQQLQVRGWLRSIRVENDKDVITQVPDRLAYATVLTNSIYRPVGIELKLYPSVPKDGSSRTTKGGGRKAPRLRFPTCHSTRARHLADDASRAAWNSITRPVRLVQLSRRRRDYAVNHSCKEYSDRLASAANDLHSRTLDDLVDEYMRHCLS